MISILEVMKDVAIKFQQAIGCIRHLLIGMRRILQRNLEVAERGHQFLSRETMIFDLIRVSDTCDML